MAKSTLARPEISTTPSKILPLILILASALLRMSAVTRPFLGNFAIYSTAQAMVSRFFIQEHFRTLLYPKVNVLVNGKPSLILLYYPVSSLITALAVKLTGMSMEFWGRFQAVVFFSLAAFYLYRLVNKIAGQRVGLTSLAVFCLFPLTIIYGQSFQNEMATVFFSAAFFFHFLRLIETGGLFDLAASALFFSGVMITRPNNLFMLAPAAYMLFIPGTCKVDLRAAVPKVILAFALSAVLPGLWFWHVWKVSNSENNIYSTLFAQLMVRSSFASPLALKAGYHLKIFDIMSGIVLTPVGFTFLIAGFVTLVKDWRRLGFFAVWSLAFLGSSLLIPRKLVDHNFYWLHMLPGASVLVAAGFLSAAESFSSDRRLHRIFVSAFACISLAVSLRYAAHPAFKTPAEDCHLLHIARKVDEVTSKDSSRVIVQGMHALLYYADRLGWPFIIDREDTISDYYSKMNWEKLPEDKWRRRNEAYRYAETSVDYLQQEEGATHFVVTNPQEFYRNEKFARHMMEKYDLLYQEKNVCLIFRLTPSASQSRLSPGENAIQTFSQSK